MPVQVKAHGRLLGLLGLCLLSSCGWEANAFDQARKTHTAAAYGSLGPRALPALAVLLQAAEGEGPVIQAAARRALRQVGAAF